MSESRATGLFVLCLIAATVPGCVAHLCGDHPLYPVYNHGSPFGCVPIMLEREQHRNSRSGVTQPAFIAAPHGVASTVKELR
jgi:hypothetical protein